MPVGLSFSLQIQLTLVLKAQQYYSYFLNFHEILAYSMSHGKSLFLGELVYDLNELPFFYVVEIETEVKRENGEFKKCLSRRLRYEAVKEFLKLNELAFPHAVNFKAKKNQLGGRSDDQREKDHIGPINHLILICKDKSELNERTGRFLRNKDAVKLEDTREHRWENEVPKFYDVFCRLKKGRIVKPPIGKENDGGLYRRCLTTYVCQRAKEDSDTADGPYPANTELLLNAKSKLDRIIDPDRTCYSLKTSSKPGFDVLKKQLHLKASLALQFRKTVMVPQFFRDYLGTIPLGTDCSDKLALIRAILIGLEVNVDYPKKFVEYPRKIVKHDTNSDDVVAHPKHLHPDSIRSLRTTRSNSSIRGLFNDSLNTVAQPDSILPDAARLLYKLNANRSQKGYRIQEIRLPKDVPTFRFENETVSVSTYLKKKKGVDVKFPSWPLARVRVNSWIPLEFLQIRSGQILRDVGHLSGFIESESKDLDAIDQHYKDMAIIDKEDRYHLNDPTPGNPIFNEGYKLYRPLSTGCHGSKAPRNKSFKGVEKKGSKPRGIYFIYLPSKLERPEDSKKFVGSVSSRFCSASQEKNGTNDFNFDATHRVIKIERPLLLENHFQDGEWGTIDLIVAVIDDTSRTREAIEQIRAEVYRYAHQRVGRLAMCVSKKNLVNSFEVTTHEDYFPIGLLQKINYMLGGTNYELAMHPLEEIATQIKENAMAKKEIESSAADLAKAVIMGAHLAHPGSAAGVGCPSVGALVQADETGTRYPGSARLQPTLERSIEKNPDGPRKSVVKHFTQQRIVELDDMVAERLSSCLEQYQASKSIIFFRHGLHPESASYPATVKAEIEQIVKGCSKGEEKPSARPKITYITVARNGKMAGQSTSLKDGLFPTEGNEKHKYRYDVAQNDLGMSDSQLRTLVSAISAF